MVAGAALLAALALLLARATGSPGQPPPAPAGAGPTVTTLAAAARDGLAPVVRSTGASLQAAVAAERRRRAAHRRTVELRRLRGSRTVRAALRRMWLAGRIDRPHYLRARSVLWRARRTAARLRGARAAELRHVLAIPASLARRRLLTSSRLTLVLLTVERNARFWALRPWPRPGQRVRFARDPVVFRYEPGQGLQVHMLSTAGYVNGLARDCLYDVPRCNRARVRRALLRLHAIAARRGGFVAWESLYRWGGGGWPWVSAMTQGTAIQALARGSRALGDRRFMRVARRALGAFEQPPPVGVAVRAPGGRAYLMYSFAPRERILNGFLQAITGVRDLAVLSGSRRARRIFRRGDRAARAALPRYDTGAWSLYELGGAESPLGYHRLTAAFLRNLCRRTGARAYCGEARRYARYEREPPRIGLQIARRTRVGRSLPVIVALSKLASVRIAVAGPGGPVVLRTGLLARGGHGASWAPRRPGRYRLQVVATGVSGPRAVAVREITVRPRPRPRSHARRTGQHRAPVAR